MNRYCFQHAPRMHLNSVQSGRSPLANVTHPFALVHCVVLTDLMLCCRSGRCSRPQCAGCVLAGGGLKSFAAGHLAYLLIRQFQLLIEDFSVNVELDQAVDSPAGEHGCSCFAAVVHAMHLTDQANTKQHLKTVQKVPTACPLCCPCSTQPCNSHLPSAHVNLSALCFCLGYPRTISKHQQQ